MSPILYPTLLISFKLDLRIPVGTKILVVFDKTVGTLDRRPETVNPFSELFHDYMIFLSFLNNLCFIIGYFCYFILLSLSSAYFFQNGL